MRLARPSILWRFVQVELWRLLLITASILAIVIAFAFAMKPVADGRVAGLDAFKLIGYVIIPMLQYALPFAAGFAATLSYHRMAQDNELTAVYAGGISHRTMLLPAALSGLILAGVVFFMADQVMPRLLRRAQELITNDFTQLLATSVDRGQAFVQESGRHVLFAERFVSREPEPGSGVFKRFDLLGLVIIQRKPTGGLNWEVSAGRAAVSVYRGSSSEGGGLDDKSMTVVMRLFDSVGGRQGGATGLAGESTISIVVPSKWKEDPKFLSMSEMRQAMDEPRRIGEIEGDHVALAAMLAERSIADVLRGALRMSGRVTLSDSSGRTVVLKAANLAESPEADGFALTSTSGAIEVTTVQSDGRLRLHRSKRAWVSVPPPSPQKPESLVSIIMNEVSAGGASVAEAGGEQTAGVIKEYVLPNLRLTEDPLPALIALSSTDLLARGEQSVADHPADQPLAATANRFERVLRDGRNEVLSKLHERFASSLACAVMVVLGAVMGMRLGSSLPLAVYLWSFLPALATVLLISGGQRAAAAWGFPGLFILYGGVAALSLITFIQFRKLATR